ncbi:MAG TPA: LLM class flavin-dependent oxidoreductase [Candidatus Binataceae bacterium]|nr:LLM class flavin-dependent oxidoreductase [Candidatus Binataceae bacterium]
MREIRFGIFLPTHDFAKAKATAQSAEEQGYYSVSINDHFFSPMGADQRKVPQLECYTTLSAIAALTTRIRLAPMVTAMSFRNPALLAKMTSTLDQISGGRFIAGLGSGWLRDEYDANGYPYPSNAERLAQLAEGIRVLKAMWTQPEPAFSGRYFKIDQAYNFPQPAQKPHPPMMIGGGGSKLLKIAGEEADIANVAAPITAGVADFAAMLKFDKAELRRRIGMLRQFATAAGRDPNAIEISGFVTVMPAADKSQSEAIAEGTAKSMGFAGAQAVRDSPMFLVGTPDEIKREIKSRSQELGLTYYVTVFMADEARELFARQVMPEFTR